MAAVTVRDVVALMEIIAPTWMACDKDPVGLHAGDLKKRVRSILLALDATGAVVGEAHKRKCQMIVTHHPRIYRPLKTLTETDYRGSLLAELVRRRIALYCAHTNLDVAPGGVNDTLADLAGLGETTPLVPVTSDRYLKLAVFVPEGHVDAVREALCDAGAGCIGEYSDCTFRSPGLGTFRGGNSTKPFLGEAGRLEEAEEWRLETILPASRREAVIRAMTEAHPYEEVAYDLYPMEGGTTYGLGRVGPLRKPVTLKTLATRLKKATGSGETLVSGDPKKRVQRLAVWSGGSCPMAKVIAAGVDAIVSGEIGYHDLELLEAAGVGAVALGHGPSETIVLPVVAQSLREGFEGVEVYVSSTPVPAMYSV